MSKEYTMPQLQFSTDLLVGEGLSEEEIRSVMHPAGFADWRAAHQRLKRMGQDPRMRQILAASLPRLLQVLSSAANPDRTLLNLERLVQSCPDGLQFINYVARNPRALEILATLFAGSQFLTETGRTSPVWVQYG